MNRRNFIFAGIAAAVGAVARRLSVAPPTQVHVSTPAEQQGYDQHLWENGIMPVIEKIRKDQRNDEVVAVMEAGLIPLHLDRAPLRFKRILSPEETAAIVQAPPH